MSKCIQFLVSTLVAGMVVVAPVYLGVLLLLKAMKALGGVLRPIAKLLPEWLPAGAILALLLVLLVCFLVGLVTSTRSGKAIRRRIEHAVFEKVPGYTLFRSLTQRLAGESEDEAWEPALAEIEEALVPAFIIERLADGRYTVFVPSVPTPLAGAVYVLSPERVHPVNVPFTHAMMVVTRWGSGCQELVAAMQAGTARPGAAAGGAH
jgi:uncharacterized membrane protein